MTILSLRKRLRIIRAALFQRWEEQTCPRCKTVFYCQTGLCTDQICAACDDQMHEDWRVSYVRNQGVA